jgi:site-specific DNA-methyltransferase (adenine-specific)
MTNTMISEVYNMDCIEGMKQYPDNHFDLAIVDPPYGELE